MSEYLIISPHDDAWHILNRIFPSDSPLMKSQFFELYKPNFINTGEIKLWISILIQAMEDWINYKKHPMSDSHKRLTRDIEEWAFKSSFTMDRIGEAMEAVFDVDSEIFTQQFRKWLIKNKTVDITKKYHLDTPFESYEEIKEEM